MTRVAKTVSIVLPTVVLVLLAGLATCQRGGRLSKQTEHRPIVPYAPSAATGPARPPAFPTSVRVYIKMDIRKQYGFLAHVAKHRDSTERRGVYTADGPWWLNPLVVYEDTSTVHDPDVAAGADAATIGGGAESTNVAVALTLVPHADLLLKTLPKSDAVKGTITVTIAALSDYYDGEWTEMARVQDKVLVFTFDTRDTSRPMEAVASENRTEPGFAFERYTREHEKWEPQSAWPADAASGDWRITIYGKDISMELTTYRYTGESIAKTLK